MYLSQFWLKFREILKSWPIHILNFAFYNLRGHSYTKRLILLPVIVACPSRAFWLPPPPPPRATMLPQTHPQSTSICYTNITLNIGINTTSTMSNKQYPIAYLQNCDHLVQQCFAQPHWTSLGYCRDAVLVLNGWEKVNKKSHTLKTLVTFSSPGLRFTISNCIYELDKS